jgi:hypothetical protein
MLMNNSSERLISILSNSWAGLLLSITGIVIALLSMRSHRRPAMLVLIAMIVMLLNALRWPTTSA